MKKRVFLRVAYDGTNYHGFQLQAGDVTIESVLNDHLTRLLGEEIHVIGASRTDAGVHSLGTVCVFDTHHRMPAEKICLALNQKLPEDIRVTESCLVREDFHPRKCDSEKTYEYVICNRRVELPTRRLSSYFYHYPLDVEAMKEAASYLVGEHDFTSFCALGSSATTFTRTLYECSVSEAGGYITLRLRGNGFLYNMVRIIAGTLIEVGGGKREPSELKKILDAKNREAAGPTAPAKGLTMIGITFKDDPRIPENTEK